jgi:Zn finger protein HypA/HybF involved in hydrogenase expression
MTYHIHQPTEETLMANATLKTAPAKKQTCPHCKASWKLRTLKPLRCPRCSRRLAPR